MCVFFNVLNEECLACLYPTIINFDAVYFSESRSKEVMFLLMLSVGGGRGYIVLLFFFLTLMKDIYEMGAPCYLLRTRRVLLLYRVYGMSVCLVLN